MNARGTILVVDDQIEMVAGIQLTLETAGYRVVTACDGHLAIEQLQHEPVDLILADIAMPQVNGYQLYEHIRHDPNLVRIPFLFLTARAMASDIRYGKALGVDDYLIKPIKPEDLLAAVEGRLRRARDLACAAMPDQAEASGAEKTPAGRTLIVGALRIAPEQHRVWFGDQEIRMSARIQGSRASCAAEQQCCLVARTGTGQSRSGRRSGRSWQSDPSAHSYATKAVRVCWR